VCVREENSSAATQVDLESLTERERESARVCVRERECMKRDRETIKQRGSIFKSLTKRQREIERGICVCVCVRENR